MQELANSIKQILELGQKVDNITTIQKALNEARTIKLNAESELKRTSIFNLRRRKEIKHVIQVADEGLLKLNEMFHKVLKPNE